jgi:hypothetical protein
MTLCYKNSVGLVIAVTLASAVWTIWPSVESFLRVQVCNNQHCLRLRFPGFPGLQPVYELCQRVCSSETNVLMCQLDRILCTQALSWLQ